MDLPNRLVSTKEMARILGISETTLIKRLKNGEYPPNCWSKGEEENSRYRFWPQRMMDHIFGG